MVRKLVAEFIGTFWLVFGGCGSALIAAAFPHLGIGFLGVAFAFGLTVMTGIYAVGYISGGHFNPAVTIGVWAAGRIPTSDIPGYIIAQVAGAIAAAGTLYVILHGQPHFVTGGFASNGYGALSPGHYSLAACFIGEVVCTFFFLYVILGATSAKAPAGFAGVAIGLCLTLIHLIMIPVDNTSVNPARSTGPALIAGGHYLQQLWLFWVAPVIGAAIAGVLVRWLHGEKN
jgi:aquaporin Z